MVTPSLPFAPVPPPDAPPPHSTTFSYSAELRRKALHILALVIPLGMGWVGSPTAQILVGAGALLAVTGDLLRAYSAKFRTWIRWTLGSMMRMEERVQGTDDLKLNGATHVLLGAALLALLFPLRVVVPVLTMTMLADAAAALVGRRWGRHTWGSASSTVEGSTAFLLSGGAVMAAFGTLPVGAAAASVVGGAVMEASPLPINDNVTVPLVAAAVVVGTEALLGGPLPMG